MLVRFTVRENSKPFFYIIYSSFVNMNVPCTNALKGQRAASPGQRPGYSVQSIRPERAKAPSCSSAFALSGRSAPPSFTQGVLALQATRGRAALGWLLVAPSGRAMRGLLNLNYKTDSGRKPMQRHQLSPTTWVLLSKEMDRCFMIKFFPKCRICVRFGKNSTLVKFIYEKD